MVSISNISNERGEQLNLKEKSWIKKIQRTGNRDAAEKLVNAYYQEIYHYLKKQISDENIALDLTQETFISVLKTIQFYDHKKGASFRTWLYRIATNKMIDWFRSLAYKQDRQSISFEEIVQMDSKDIALDYEHKWQLKQVERYIHYYAADIQMIFRLHIYGNYTFNEIAIITKQSEGTVKSKYYRLIKQIREEFHSDN